MVTKKKTDSPPACWVAAHSDKPKSKLTGIWRKYNKTTKKKIKQKCAKTKKSGAGTKKKFKSGSNKR